MTFAPWIAYVGPIRFPWGQPGSRRVYGMAKALALAGMKVVVGSGERGPNTPELIEREQDGELWHVGLGELHRPEASLLAKAFTVLVAQGAKTVRWLDAQESKPSHVIVYGGYAPFMARLLPWCRRNRVRLVADVVEWYQPSHLPGGAWGPFHASTSLSLRYFYPRCDGIVAISSYLERYYQRRSVKVVRVPPTLDVIGTRCREPRLDSSSRPLALLYAGTPGKKDLLPTVIRAFAQVDSDGTRAQLTVLGITVDETMRLMGSGAALPRSVRVVGRIPQQDVAQAYLAADFSVLLRSQLRYAHAGFPTKVAESLAAGVPVILNLTSDLGEYVRDGVEGVWCAVPTVDALADALRRALSLSALKRTEMSQAARRAAERVFDFRNYAGQLSDFLGWIGQ